MDAHSLEILEFPKIVAELVASCFSEEGRALLRTSQPLSDPQAIKHALKLAKSFRRILESETAFPAMDFADIQAVTPRLHKKGMVLETEDLSVLARYLRSASRLRQHILRVAEDQDLRDIAGEIPDLYDLVKQLYHYVDEEGNLRDKSIPELAAIWRGLRRLKRDLRSVAEGYLKDEARGQYWQADVPAERNGRLVLPLKSNFRGRIEGVIHEMSPSGATVFIEPQEILLKNNEIVAERNRYQRVVRKLLRDVSEKVSQHYAEIITTQQTVARLDGLHAKSEYAIHHHCLPAEYRAGAVQLLQARHPLLGSDAVPIDVSLGETYRVIVVTGPNTGGKTVTLKTIGLLSIMNQFGMEIPAQESCLGVFDGVYADIGDEQSIEQSLSTFSSHMGSIADIIARSTTDSLVLLDELGSGTDPAEGTAIGMALLDHFIDTGCLCAATTHHGILKDFAYSKPEVENAGMDFDRETLSPSYRLILGIPGESHAFEIAARIGIPHNIIENADSYLRNEQKDVSELIRRLSNKHRQLMRDEVAQRQKETQITERSRETDLKELRLKQKERELREHGLRDLKRFLAESRRALEGIVREMREGELTKEKIQRQVQFVANIQERIEQEEHEYREDFADLESQGQDFHMQEGMEVVVQGTAKRGRLLRRGKHWLVETDTVRMAVDPSDVRPVGGDVGGRDVEVLYEESSANSKPSYELDLRGLRLQEALLCLEKQIDSALLWGLSEFSVIHGKGEGILQEGIQRFLAQNRLVEEHRFSRPDAGGFGKTIVRLKA